LVYSKEKIDSEGFSILLRVISKIQLNIRTRAVVLTKRIPYEFDTFQVLEINCDPFRLV